MGPFGDGDIINNMSLDPDIVLAGMHINVIAEDETLGTRIKNQIDISFTNECGVPSFNVGDSIGWVEIYSLVPPSNGGCGYPSLSPSVLPISVPTYSPTASPTTSPTCNCFPKEISFKFNFSLSCEDTNVGGAAVRETSCFVDGFGQMVNDYVPVAIEAIDILELGTDLNVIHQSSIRGSFRNDDVLSYTAYAVTFSNECGVQLFEVGDNIGWSGSPTLSPSASPSTTPTTSTSSPSISEIEDQSEPTLAPATASPVTPHPTFTSKTAKNTKAEVDLGSSYDILPITIKNRICGDTVDSPGCLCRLSHAAVSIVDIASGNIAKIFLGDMCGKLEWTINVNEMEGSFCET
eukprot:scaffold96598_cov22-Cyclotella_meneghiniana.AAC.1